MTTQYRFPIMKLVLVGVLALCVLAQGMPTTAAPSTQEGTIVADIGFRPEVNGLPFENYGTGPYTNLTPEDVRRAFGDEACASLKDGKCILVPPAEQAMIKLNEMMGGGHCYGFSVLALRMYQDKIKAADLGADVTTALKLDGNEKLQREIAYSFIFQRNPAVRNGTIVGTPNEILEKLVENLKQGKGATETYTLALFKRDGTGGHAITPYAVVDKGSGVYGIQVYDNNFPAAAREMVVDTNANTWVYFASINPDVAEAKYDGDAETKSLWLMPTAAGLVDAPCGFCQRTASKLSAAYQTQTYNEFYLDGDPVNHGHLLITDKDGHRVGYADGKIVNEIPGALVDRPLTDEALAGDTPEPIYSIPTGIEVVVTIDGTGLPKTDETSVVVVGPGYDLGVYDIMLDPGQQDTMVIAADGNFIRYETKVSETPTMIMGLVRPGADFEFEVQGHSNEGGSVINLTLDPKSDALVIDTQDTPGTGGMLALSLTKIDDEGEENFTHDEIPLEPEDELFIYFDKWAGQGGTVDVGYDRGGEGNVEDTVSLTDEQ